MKYDHNQICTKNNEVEVSNIYDFKEDSYIAEVEVLSATSDEEGIGFRLKVLKANYDLDKEFNCWAAAGKYAYSGMWRIWDRGIYTWSLD